LVLYRQKSLIKLSFGLAVILMLINYFDFVKFYWYPYAKYSIQYFGELKMCPSFQVFSQIAEKTKQIPFIDQEIIRKLGPTGDFYKSIYFSKLPETVSTDQTFPANSLILTERQNIPNFHPVENIQMPYYFLLSNTAR